VDGQLDASRHPVEVARDLLGWTIVCRGTAAVIVEAEAYHQDEPASHSYGGVPTPRTEHLFGAAGTLYVYFTYGMHWCANLVTGEPGSGEAVLLRAAMPVVGEPLMRLRRAARRAADPERLPAREVASGPARLVEALGIVPADNGAQLLPEAPMSVAAALECGDAAPVLVRDMALAAGVGVRLPLTSEDLLVGPRIGITKAADLPWRFGVRGAMLSRPFREPT
jgi:DNA-3-methyladenine glycosylase